MESIPRRAPLPGESAARLQKAVKPMRSHTAAPWRVIYIARGEKQACQIEDMLRGAGFMMERTSLEGADARSEDIEIKVLESEAEEARMFLMEQGL